MNLTLLIVLTAACAASFLIIIDLLRHRVFFGVLHTTPGFIATYVATAAGVAVFSWAVFGLIKRLEGQLLEQNRRLAALNRVALLSAQHMQLQQLLKVALDCILETEGVASGVICTLGLEHEDLSGVYHRGFSEALVQRIRTAKLAADPVGEHGLPTSQPVVMERLFEDPGVGEAARDEGIHSGLGLLLFAQGEVIGLLVIASREQRRFHPAEVELLASMSTQLGLAIRNSVLYENALRISKEMATLRTVGTATPSSLRLNARLERGIDVALEVMGVEEAEVWLVVGQEVVMQMHRGPFASAFMERTRFKLGEGFPGIVAQTGRPLIAHHLSEERWFLRQQVKKAGYNTFGAWPLIHEGKVLGVLGLASRSPEALTRPSELRLLDGVIEHLAVAIATALLYRQMRDTADMEDLASRP
ncbi:MAG: GAF domain-containing protein [Chloroflexi bacterium]|nr:GAF domain-containing protein [Chloroflexota bacterium]